MKFLPFLFIFFIWFIFAHPYFLKGKIPYAAAYQVNNFAPWDAYPQLRGPVKNGAMPDVTTQIYPWKHFTIETWKQKEIPLWNPYSFAGTPHAANYQSAVFTPMNVLFFILPFRDAWSLLILLQPLLAGICMYMFVRSLNMSIWGSLLSAISFMFCGFITVWMDYGTLAYAILFLPLALFAIEKFYVTGKIRFAILFSLTIPLSFFSGHFQISIYFFIGVFVYQIYKLISVFCHSELTNKKILRIRIAQDDKVRYIKKSSFLFLYTLFGLLISLPQILPSLEFYSQSLRSTLFQKGEVIPWGYLPTFIAPDFFGNPVTRNDWFGHYAEWNAYIGVLPLLLGFYALKKKDKKIYFFFFFGLTAFLLAFFTPILDVLIALHVPVLSTSATSRIIVLFSFAFIILAGFGLDTLLDDIKKNNKRSIIVWFVISLFVFCLLWLMIITKNFIPIEKISIARQNLILPTGIFIITYIVLGIASLFDKLKIRNDSRSILYIGFLLILITSFDMLRFAAKWQEFDSKELAFIDVPVTNFFPRIAGYERVIGNFGAETALYYHLPSLGGYDALYISRYGQFISSLENGKIKNAERSVVTFPHNSRYTSQTINLVNVAYIVHKVSDDKQGWTFPYWNYPDGQFKKIFDDGAYRIYKNTNVFPRAFLVDSYIVKKNPQEILDTLFSNRFNMRQQIILEKDPEISFSRDTNNNSTKITQFSSNSMTIMVHAEKNNLLFTSDPFYPGWQATIDGKKTEIFRADFAFRAIKIPKGKHTIQFIYQPISFTRGIYGMLSGIISLFVVSLFSSRKKWI